MLIARPISWPSPKFSGCRQLSLKCWDRGIDSRLQGRVRYGSRSCHLHKRRHRKRCQRRRACPGTWLRFGIAQEIGLLTSVPYGEKENSVAVVLLAPAPVPRRARDLLLECLGNGVLLTGVAAEPNEREETIRLAVLGFAVGEAGESPEPPPVRRAWIGIVATCQRLCDECSD